MMTRLLLLAAALAAVALSACGAVGRDRPGGEARLMLDAPPNAVHTGIYLAETRGFTDAEGVDLTIEAPDENTDALQLLRENRIAFAVLGLDDLALAREAGADIVAVMGIVQRPLTAIYSGATVRSPRGLEGKRVGLSGRPGEAALLDAVLAAVDADPAGVRRKVVGFDAAAALLDGRVDAVVADRTVAGVALKAERPDIREFRIDAFGAPPSPDLVLVTERTTVQDRPELVQATVTALRRGYLQVGLGPEEAVGVLTQRVDGADRRTIQAQLDVLLPSIAGSSSTIGRLDVRAIGRWADWAQRLGVTRERADPAKLAVPRFATRGVIDG